MGTARFVNKTIPDIDIIAIPMREPNKHQDMEVFNNFAFEMLSFDDDGLLLSGDLVTLREGLYGLLKLVGDSTPLRLLLGRDDLGEENRCSCDDELSFCCSLYMSVTSRLGLESGDDSEESSGEE